MKKQLGKNCGGFVRHHALHDLNAGNDYPFTQARGGIRQGRNGRGERSMTEKD